MIDGNYRDTIAIMADGKQHMGGESNIIDIAVQNFVAQLILQMFDNNGDINYVLF